MPTERFCSEEAKHRNSFHADFPDLLPQRARLAASSYLILRVNDNAQQNLGLFPARKVKRNEKKERWERKEKDKGNRRNQVEAWLEIR